MLTESFKGVSRKFKGCFRGCFKKVSNVFQVICKGVSSNFKGVSRVFERTLKGVAGKFQWCFRKF